MKNNKLTAASFIALLFIVFPSLLWSGETDSTSASIFHNRLLLNNSSLQFSQNNSFYLTETKSTLSKGKAFLKSLLLPGWGEISAGAPGRGKVFLIAEGILWSGFAAMQIYGHWKQSDLENFAIEHAGVNGRSKDKSFYTDVSNYEDIYEYNEAMRQLRRYDDIYPVNDEHYWKWQNNIDREHFDDLRISSRIAFRNATLVLGGVLLNHVLSAIDAIWISRKNEPEISSKMQITPILSNEGDVNLQLNVTTNW